MKKIYFLIMMFLTSASLLAQWTTSGTNINNSNTGNVGVGTSTPAAKLDVLGNSLFLTGTHRIYFSEAYAFDPTIAGFRNNDGNLVVNAKNGGVLYLNRDIIGDTKIQSNSVDIIVFKSNGTVGIGTDNTGPYKLAVEGSIGARVIKVTVASPWADYVFGKSYQLKPLPDLDNYIQTNKHLPGVPTTDEVQRDGIDLGKMNTKLLEKVEELTLYVIELNKKIELLEKDRASAAKK